MPLEESLITKTVNRVIGNVNINSNSDAIISVIRLIRNAIELCSIVKPVARINQLSLISFTGTKNKKFSMKSSNEKIGVPVKRLLMSSFCSWELGS